MDWIDRRALGAVAAALALGLGCSVGEAGDGFTGPSLTFGAEGPPADSSESATGDGGTGNDGGSGVVTGSQDDGSSGGPPPGCTPTAEICDGMDNDCDGAVDNGNPGSGDACETGVPGECAAGVTSCEAGAIACVPVSMGTTETCDGVDNDCNGAVDDNTSDSGAVCNTGMPGVCTDGTSACTGGAIECVPDTMGSAEACDGIDNDCDGAVDNGNPGGGGACDTGMPGICGPGTQQCSGGGLNCVQNQAAAANEVCGNGLDDDCNAQVDDGCSTCVHDICLTGLALDPACDPCVASICAADPFCCSNSWDALCVGAVLTVCGIVC